MADDATTSGVEGIRKGSGNVVSVWSNSYSGLFNWHFLPRKWPKDWFLKSTPVWTAKKGPFLYYFGAISGPFLGENKVNWIATLTLSSGSGPIDNVKECGPNSELGRREFDQTHATCSHWPLIRANNTGVPHRGHQEAKNMLKEGGRSLIVA